MGNDLEPTVPSMTTLASSRTFSRPNRESPTLTGIQLRLQAERAQRLAEKAAKEARELAEHAQRQADKKHKRACARLIEADRAVARVADVTKQVDDAAKVEQRAQELSKEVRKAVMKEAPKLARKAKKERKRSMKMYEDVERAIAAAKRDKERAIKVAEEKSREAEVRRALAEEVSRTAAEKARKAMEANEEAAMRLKDDIQPVVTPSCEEVVAAKWHIQYKEDCFHFAVAGVSGRRKYSLLNALRGLRGRDAAAVAADVTRKTLQMTRYPDANPKKPFAWYDIPGAGNLKCRDWQYFNNQGLYVFDCIIVLFDNRFTMTDIAILINARRFNIPTYIVRPNADQHIRKIMRKKRHGRKGDDEDPERRNKLYEAAREQFIEKTRKSVQVNLKVANLPDQRVYIVSNPTLLSVVLNKVPKKMIDEVDLLDDLLNRAYTRRFIRRSDETLSTRFHYRLKR